MEISNFLKFLKKNKWYYFLAFCIYLTVYWFWMTQFDIGIDTEVMIGRPGYAESLSGSGRWGIGIIHNIFNVSWFNPLFCLWVGFFMLFFSFVVFGYCIYYFCETDSKIGVFLSVAVLTNGVMPFQLYFQNQIFVFGIAYSLVSFAILLSYMAFYKKLNFLYVPTVLLTIIAFSVYQAFNYIYITLSVLLSILIYLYKEILNDSNKTPKNSFYWGLFTSQICVFLFAFILNQIITKVFFISYGYVENQIIWGKLPVSSIIHNIMNHFVNVFTGRGFQFFWTYGVFAILSTGILLYKTIKINNPSKYLFIFATILFNLCPFLLTFILGGSPVIRSQLAYPIVFSGNMAILFILCKKNIFKIIASFLIAISVIANCQIVSRLIYTDLERRLYDKNMVTQIFNEASIKNPLNKPYFIVGSKSANLSHSTYKIDVFGASFFEWDKMALPHYFNSSVRIAGYANVMGFNASYIKYEYSETERMEYSLEARKAALSMPVWPEDGCMKDMGEYFLIKISEDEWPEELQ